MSRKATLAAIAVTAVLFLARASGLAVPPLSSARQETFVARNAIMDRSTASSTLAMTDAGFKIMVVSDTHVLDGQGSQAPENVTRITSQTTQALERYIAMERPDFIVHNGDLLSGEAANSTQDVREAMQQLLKPIVQAQIPFASSKGNHDNDKYSTHASLTDLEVEIAGPLARSKKAGKVVVDGDTHGSDNYWVPIYPSASSNHQQDRRPAFLLWFFDSRSGKTMITDADADADATPQQQSLPNFVDPSVATWYKNETTRLRAQWGTLPPSLAFVHIPPHESAITQQQLPYGPEHVGGVLDETPQNFTRLNKTYPGLNDDEDFGGQGAEDSEAPNGGYTGQDRPFLEALETSTSRVHAIVSGHQHGNDWCAPTSLRTDSQSTIPVCFAKHSGFGGYDYDNWNHGVRIFHLKPQNLDTGIDTWIRFLTGETRYETKLDDAFADRVPRQ